MLIIFIGEVTGTQVQQSSSSSNQIQEKLQFSTKNINEFISNLKENIDEIKLEKEEALELEAKMTTVEVQLASPKPKERIIKESIESIRRILEGASGSAIGQLLTQISSLF